MAVEDPVRVTVKVTSGATGIATSVVMASVESVGRISWCLAAPPR